MTDRHSNPDAGVGLRGVHVLAAAQRQASRVVADARVLAAQVAGDAEVYREKMLAQAQADAEAERIRCQAGWDAARMLAEIRARAPLGAQARYAYYRALGDALGAQLTATLASLQAVVSASEAREDPEQLELPL